jgi:outer membrane protein
MVDLNARTKEPKLLRHRILTAVATVCFTLATLFCTFIPVLAAETTDNTPAPSVRKAGLEECLQIALKNNRRRPASRYAVVMAEAQHRQALAAYWPQIGVRGGYQHMDEPEDFIFPASTISLPPVTVPGLGAIPLNSVAVPQQDIKLMDEDSFRASLKGSWLLYDGGMRRGLSEQTQGRVDMMKQESRRTDLEIIDSVKRYYYGAVLASQLYQVGKDTLGRMEGTLSLTESLYKTGSGKVKKTDWLGNKVVVESLKAMLATLEKNVSMAQAALANTMGLPWNSSVVPTDTFIPYVPMNGPLNGLVGTAYQFNPDWGKMEAGLRAAAGALRSARSGYFPKLALTGELHKWWNNYDAGYATDANKEGWSVGMGVQIPIFNGFLTKNRIAEARARLARLKEQKILLKEGIGLQVKDRFLSLKAAEKSHQATQNAMEAAAENRELNIRAYQNELVETDKVVRAQLVEALMSAQYYKACYDHVALLSQLNLIVGSEVLKKMNE